MISVTVLTKNSEETLKATLESLSHFPEVLVADTGSTDATVEIASRFPNVRVVHLPFNGFGKTRNAASALATYDWILPIDSDEVLTPELGCEILEAKLDEKSVYILNRVNYFNGKKMLCCSGWHPDPIIRLYHRRSTRYTDDEVHESVLSEGFQRVSFKGELSHTPYRSIDAFLSKMQLYSTLFAAQNAGKKRSTVAIALGHALGAFFKNYFLKRGFLGGKEGLIISLYNTHTTYYKYLKLHFANRELTAEPQRTLRKR